MDIDYLHRDVQAFRWAVEACQGDLDPILFGRFPRGCCGAVSELLAAFLESRGHGMFAYVCGLRFGGDASHSSHAWLERDGILVDITRDQFGDDGEPVLVTTDCSWHDDEFPKRERMSDLGDLVPELCQAYARIMKEMERQNGAL